MRAPIRGRVRVIADVGQVNRQVGCPTALSKNARHRPTAIGKGKRGCKPGVESLAVAENVGDQQVAKAEIVRNLKSERVLDGIAGKMRPEAPVSWTMAAVFWIAIDLSVSVYSGPNGSIEMLVEGLRGSVGVHCAVLRALFSDATSSPVLGSITSTLPASVLGGHRQ